MQEQASTDRPQKRVRWYNHPSFPLVPQLDIRKANRHNTAGWTFRWLFLTLWTLDQVEFELTFVCSTHWGIGFVGIVPYLRWTFAVPCPERWGTWISQKTGRKCLAQRMRIVRGY